MCCDEKETIDETAEQMASRRLFNAEARVASLEVRVLQLQKDAELIATFCAVAGLAALYFALQYYQKNIASIPGIQS